MYYPKYVEECPIAVEYKGCKKCEKGCGDDTLWGWDWAEPVVYKDPKCEVIEYECEKVRLWPAPSSRTCCSLAAASAVSLPPCGSTLPGARSLA